MKKILFVINTMGRAGAEKSMIELMKTIDSKRFEIHLLVLINRGEMFDEVPAYVKIHNKKPDHRPVLGATKKLIFTVIKSAILNLSFIHNIQYLYQNMKEQRNIKQKSKEKLLWKLISDGAPKLLQKFDLAIAYLEGGATYYVADHVRADKKIAYLHIDYKKAGYTARLDHGCYDKLDQIFVVSKEAMESFLSVYPNLKSKVQLFYNIINTEVIKSLAEEKIEFDDDFHGIRILTIGRLHYQKAYDIAIPILADLRNAGYRVKWYVIGEGALRTDLEKLISEYQVEDSFILLGAKSNPYPYLKQCDLYVHASRYEGKSIAIEEAQVLGKAIIASDCSGNREQIQDGVNGIIVKLDKEEICNAIVKVLHDIEIKEKFEIANKNIDFDHRRNLEQLYCFLGENE